MNNSSSKHFFFSSESVTEGHPDKICDSISDTILDACLSQDPQSKVSIQTIVKCNIILIAGELSTKALINIEHLVRERLKEIGYDNEEKGIDYKTCDIIQKISKQSPEITKAIYEDKKEEDITADDQGLMFGYATDETLEYFPFSHLMANRLSNQLTKVRKDRTLPYLRPDGKTAITVEYKSENGKMIPLRIENILISTQHSPKISNTELKSGIIKHVIEPIIPKDMIDKKTKFYINPSGRFIVGGPTADTGLTGRKIIVDTYGGWASHGGGAFSGKDGSKVHRAGAYMARWIAKSLVSAKLCKRVLIQIAYSIGIADPLSVFVDSFGTATNGKSDQDLKDIVINNFDLKPGMIIKQLKLTRPIFKKTSTGGHFGRNEIDFKWEQPKSLKF